MTTDTHTWGEPTFDKETGKVHLNVYVKLPTPVKFIDIRLNLKSSVHKRKIRGHKRKVRHGSVRFLYQSMFDNPLKIFSTRRKRL